MTKCESCGLHDTLYINRIAQAAVCIHCYGHPNLERIRAAHAAERALEHQSFRKRVKDQDAVKVK